MFTYLTWIDFEREAGNREICVCGGGGRGGGGGGGGGERVRDGERELCNSNWGVYFTNILAIPSGLCIYYCYC